MFIKSPAVSPSTFCIPLRWRVGRTTTVPNTVKTYKWRKNIVCTKNTFNKKLHHLISLDLTILLYENLFSFTRTVKHVVKGSIVIIKSWDSAISIFYILTSWISFNINSWSEKKRKENNSNNRHHHHQAWAHGKYSKGHKIGPKITFNLFTLSSALFMFGLLLLIFFLFNGTNIYVMIYVCAFLFISIFSPYTKR